MTLNKIVWLHCVLKNGSYNEENNQLVFYSGDLWNYVVYAWNKINQQDYDNNIPCDPRFYYQALILNLHMLGLVTKKLGKDILDGDTNLKDLRDNISHMDEKLNNGLNFVNTKIINPDLIRKDSTGKTIINGSICGCNIHNNFELIASPLGILGDVIFSTLKPNPKFSNYKDKDFVSYQITDKKLEKIFNKLIVLLSNFYSYIHIEGEFLKNILTKNM